MEYAAILIVLGIVGAVALWVSLKLRPEVIETVETAQKSADLIAEKVDKLNEPLRAIETQGGKTSAEITVPITQKLDEIIERLADYRSLVVESRDFYTVVKQLADTAEKNELLTRALQNTAAEVKSGLAESVRAFQEFRQLISVINDRQEAALEAIHALLRYVSEQGSGMEKVLEKAQVTLRVDASAPVMAALLEALQCLKDQSRDSQLIQQQIQELLERSEARQLTFLMSQK